MAGDSVTIEHLDVNNYGTWSYRMKMLLMNKGLWAMVEDAAGEKTLKLKALSLIALHVKDHHLPTLMSAGEDPKLAWTMLENIHKAKSIARQLQLRRDINALRKGSSEPLTKYVARARTIWTDLTTSGVDIKESEVALSVLAGLPKSYDIASEVIQMTTKEPKLDDILTHLLPVEQCIVRSKAVAKWSLLIQLPRCWPSRPVPTSTSQSLGAWPAMRASTSDYLPVMQCTVLMGGHCIANLV
jgi:hypothetical protein